MKAIPVELAANAVKQVVWIGGAGSEIQRQFAGSLSTAMRQSFASIRAVSNGVTTNAADAGDSTGRDLRRLVSAGMRAVSYVFSSSVTILTGTNGSKDFLVAAPTASVNPIVPTTSAVFPTAITDRSDQGIGTVHTGDINPAPALLSVLNSIEPTFHAVVPARSDATLSAEDVITLIGAYAPQPGSFVSGGISVIQGRSYDGDIFDLDARSRVLESGSGLGRFVHPLDVTATATSTFAGFIAAPGLVLAPSSPISTSNLLYNNAGALYWNGSVVAGGSVDSWNTNGSDIYRANGNVGVGTSTPIVKFSVVGDSSLEGNLNVSGTTTLNALRVGTLNGVLLGTGGAVSSIATSSLAINTTDLIEGAGLFFTDARARSSLSSAATGITFATSTGTLSLSPGYVIPLTASTTEWTSFFDAPASRITAGTGLTWSGSSLSVSTSSLGLPTGFFAQGGNTFGGPAIIGSNDSHPLQLQTSGAVRMTIDATSGNVGIGTGLPTHKLDVTGSAFFSIYETPREFEIYSVANAATAFRVDGENGNVLLVENDFGNVGIGTTTPYGRFSVASNSGTTNLFSVSGDGSVDIGSVNPSRATLSSKVMIRSSGSDDSVQLTFLADSLDSCCGTDYAFIRKIDSGSFVISNSDNVREQHFLISTSGNIGIGASAPSSRLTVQGTSSSPTAALFTAASSSGASMFTVNANGSVGVGTTSPLANLDVYGTAGANPAFRVSSSTAVAMFTVNANGSVGIGTNSSVSRFSVNGDVAFLNAQGQGTATGFLYASGGANGVPAGAGLLKLGQSGNISLRTSGAIIVENTVVPTTFAGNVGIGTTSPQRLLHVYRNSDGPPVRFEDSNGYCEIDPTSTTWACTSDDRLKRDVVSLSASSSLDKVLQLRPVTFRWTKESNAEVKRLGLIAQEVERIYPEFVTTDDRGFKSVSYGSLAPVLVSAVQAINDRILSIDQQLAEIRENRPSAISNVITAIAGVFTKVRVSDGFEVRDVGTGQYVCVRVRFNEFVKTPGACSNVAGVSEDEPTIEPTPASTATSTATTTESVTESEQPSEDASDVSTNETQQPDDASPDTQSDASDSTETPTVADSE